jgi:uncharacterized protein
VEAEPAAPTNFPNQTSQTSQTTGPETELKEPSRIDRKEMLRTARTKMRPGTVNKLAAHRATRWIHVYTSMISFLVVLFFAATGLTLNHPTWFSSNARSQPIHGKLPANAIVGGKIDWFVVGEHLRDVNGARGSAAHDDAGPSISFRGPGYGADAQIDPTTGEYDLNVNEAGLVGVMNDLHKGRDSNRSWKWLIDVSAGLLVVISVTGLTLQFFLRKRRRSALATATIGALIVGVLTILAMR